MRVIAGIAPPSSLALGGRYENLMAEIDKNNLENVEINCFPQEVNLDDIERVYRVRREALSLKGLDVSEINHFLQALSLLDRAHKYHWVKIKLDKVLVNVIVDVDNRYASHYSLELLR
jgi:hypothetical protein